MQQIENRNQKFIKCETVYSIQGHSLASLQTSAMKCKFNFKKKFSYECEKSK